MTEDQKHTFVGLYLLKKLDLGEELAVVLPSELAPIDEPLQDLAVAGYIEIDAKHNRWVLTKPGLEYLRAVIDEAADLVDEFDDYELDEAIAVMRERNIDVARARFLWGWFEGEFDDLVLFQERRGVATVERLWAFYLTSDDLWNELSREIAPALPA